MEMIGHLVGDSRRAARARCARVALPTHVPHRAVDAGDRLEQRLAVAAGDRAREQLRPDALDGEDAHRPSTRGASSSRISRTISAPVLAVVAVVDLADEAVLGAQPRDHRRALEHGVGAPPKFLRQRNIDGDRLDGMNAHACAPLCLPGVSLPRGRGFAPASATAAVDDAAAHRPQFRLEDIRLKTVLLLTDCRTLDYLSRNRSIIVSRTQ